MSALSCSAALVLRRVAGEPAPPGDSGPSATSSKTGIADSGRFGTGAPVAAAVVAAEEDEEEEMWLLSFTSSPFSTSSSSSSSSASPLRAAVSFVGKTQRWRMRDRSLSATTLGDAAVSARESTAGSSVAMILPARAKAGATPSSGAATVAYAPPATARPSPSPHARRKRPSATSNLALDETSNQLAPSGSHTRCESTPSATTGAHKRSGPSMNWWSWATASASRGKARMWWRMSGRPSARAACAAV
mmetsp:Transcript_2367/g.8693  ORF Transcript_2367/g.8693 Transcript_2367/m.8693 type:complete len:247 (+) Transcript_2367:1480-2220(+)